MAADNVELVKRAFDAFSRGDMETALAFLHPSFEVEDRVVPEASPTKRGPDALIENVSHVWEAFGEVTWEPREIVDLGDRVLVRVHMSATARHDDLPIDEDVGHLYELTDGRAVRLDIFRTWEEAREAAGLRHGETG